MPVFARFTLTSIRPLLAASSLFIVSFAAICPALSAEPRTIESSFDSVSKLQDDGANLGDEINDGKPIRLTDEMLQRFAAELGLEPGSNRMKQILHSYYNPESNLNLAVNNDPENDSEAPVKVIRHIRGKDGIPLPSKDDVVLPFKIEKDKVKQGLDEYFGMLEKTAERNMKVPSLPACKENTTTREPTNYELPEKRDQVLVDLLFMPKENVPVDKKEIFGKRTVVRPYDRSKPNLMSLSAIGIGITCLPTRLRVTRAFVMRDEGRNALKNYDGDPHGEGEFHAYMKAKLGMGE